MVSLPQPDTSRQLVAVIDLIRRGFRVFPCYSAPGGTCTCGKKMCSRSAGKHPHTKHGAQDAVADEYQVRDWARLWPFCNWGVACGPESGVWVLDVDGDVGRKSLANLEEQYGTLPKTLRSRTGRTDGGEHVWFKYAEGLVVHNSANKLPAGLHVRGKGGYVIAPPSVHQSGRCYEWLDFDTPIASAPAWLLRMVTAPVPRTTTTTPSEIGLLLEPGRNDGLFRYGCALRRRGATVAEIERCLLDANARRCRPPLEEMEVRKVAVSASRYPVGGPDPLDAAWEPVKTLNLASRYEQLLALASELQCSRPHLPIALPLERIAALLNCCVTLVSRYRKRAELEGWLTFIQHHVPHRKARLYRFHDQRVELGEVKLSFLSSGLVTHLRSIPSYTPTGPNSTRDVGRLTKSPSLHNSCC
jgi:hypothetical protein